MLGLLLATHLFYPSDSALHRYDFITLAAILIQLAMIGLRLETWEEVKVIAAFHVVGTAMELFKTHIGSWTYPEPAVLRIGGVPLFTGFMYAAVGSYMARVWRIFEFRLPGYPRSAAAGALAITIYLNFFTHHWVPDARWLLLALMAWLFWRTRVVFRVWREDRWMPVLLGWFLVALFIWFAENIATLSRAWVYPSQEQGWHIVSPAKLVAWYLLMFISFVLVASIHRREQADEKVAQPKL